jgi:hypothetical protein
MKSKIRNKAETGTDSKTQIGVYVSVSIYFVSSMIFQAEFKSFSSFSIAGQEETPLELRFSSNRANAMTML